jgi:succinate dehydrogenase / fumarate reductase cytochrome b subunit
MAEHDRSSTASSHDRPLSPHLQIYAPMLSMVMSIVHRLTGAALYAGTILLAWWLIAASTDAKAFATASWFMSSIVGRLILFGFTWALFTHLLGGIRHMIWDSGRGFDYPQRELLAQATLVGGVVLTLIVWIIAYMVR